VAVREPLDLAGLARGGGDPLRGARHHPRWCSNASARSSAGSWSAAGTLVDQELLSRVRGRLLSAFDGQLGKLEGLVVMRAEPTGMTPADDRRAPASSRA
jgi:hypothetical protein